mgnify:CR=1 FL=1
MAEEILKGFKEGQGFILIGLKVEGKWYTTLIEFKNLESIRSLGQIAEEILKALGKVE